MDVDPGRLEAFMGQMIGHMTGAALCYSIWLGDELGLYRALAGSGPRTADSVADKTGCNPRLVREWLDGQAAGGLVAYDAGRGHLRARPRGRDGPRRRRLAGLRRPGHERVRLDVPRHAQGSPRRSAATAR